VDKGHCWESFKLGDETLVEVAFSDGFQGEDDILADGVSDGVNAITEQSSEMDSISYDLDEFILFSLRRSPFFISFDEEPHYDEGREQDAVRSSPLDDT
jgi:hypothetical protein